MIDPQKPSSRTFFAALLGLALVALLSLLIFKGNLTLPFRKETPLEMVVSSGTVKEGDIMTTILSGKGLPPPLVSKIQFEIGKSFDLRRLKPKQTFEVVTSTDGVFQKFIYHDDPTHSYTVVRSSLGAFLSFQNQVDTEWREKTIRCEVKDFLYRDLMKQGYDATFVANFIGEIGDYIFPWQIDFFTEQRPGDVITAVLQQEYLVGTDQAVHRMKILAASYTGKGTRKKENYAIRYQGPNSSKADYFDLEGKAIRKAFLRAPFTIANFRVSSNYNPKRFHPILRVYRPHHGTDYAAAIGTRVSSIGKGSVIFAGWKSGYGNTVEVRHSSKYVSRYGHLSRIGVRRGQSVNQGQYVGNVGNTGLSTGPHLHFEMLVDGSQRNFLKMDFPSASSVPNDNISDYNKVRDDLVARLSSNPSSN